MKDLYLENYKTMKKEIENILCSWVRRFHTVKMTILPVEIYDFTVIHTTAPTSFFTKLNQIILKSEEDIQMTNKYMKRVNFTNHLKIRIKTTMKYFLIPVRWLL